MATLTLPDIKPLHAPKTSCLNLSAIKGASADVVTRGPRNLRYIRGQVIITGYKNQIEDVLNSVGQPFSVSHEPIPFLTLGDDRIIGRYLLGSEGTEHAFVNAFNQHVDDNFPAGQYAPARRPLAELNYVVRQPRGAGIEGDPGDSGIEGDPFTLPAGTPVTADDFINQWAFSEECGIKLGKIFDRATRQYKEPRKWGKDVVILIFDSSPLPTGSHTIKLGNLTLDSGEAVEYPPYELHVSALIDDSMGAQVPDPMDSHGLFVANLARAVAPDSTIHLIQVLRCQQVNGKKALRGDLFTLANALHLYLEENQAMKGKSIVVNLSLGYDLDFDIIGQATGVHGFPRRMMHRRGMMPVPIHFFQEIWFPARVETRAEERQIVFVAAAGNDHKTEFQHPGTDHRVLAVAALNQSGKKAHFSNYGEVGAPGGESAPNGKLDLENACKGTNNCPEALLSIVKTESGYSYAHWAGTSFATPLVSGIAAVGLVQEPARIGQLIENPNLLNEPVTLANVFDEEDPLAVA